MTLTVHPTARLTGTTGRTLSRRRLAARALVVLAAVFVVWVASLPGGAPAQQIAPGPPASVEVLSAMHAQA